METVKIQRCTYISVAFLGISPPLSVTLLEIAVVYFCPLSVFAFSPGTEYIPLWRPYWYLLPHPTSLSHEKGDTWLLAVFNATLPLSQPCFFNSILPPWRDRSCVTAPLPTSCPWCLELQQGLDACVLCPLLPNLRKPCASAWVGGWVPWHCASSPSWHLVQQLWNLTVHEICWHAKNTDSSFPQPEILTQ